MHALALEAYWFLLQSFEFFKKVSVDVKFSHQLFIPIKLQIKLYFIGFLFFSLHFFYSGLIVLIVRRL